MTTPAPFSRIRSLAPFVAALFLIAVVAAVPAAAADRWFHITVEEDDGTSVAVNLPLTLIESAARLIPEEIDEEVRIELNEEGFDLDELRSSGRGSGN